MAAKKKSARSASQSAWSARKPKPWQPGALDFSEPVDTGQGYYFTQATVLQSEHAVQIAIRCRDRRILDQYVPALKIAYAVEPGGADAAEVPDHTDLAGLPGSQRTQDAELAADLDISIKLLTASAKQVLLRLSIDPPVGLNTTHTYRFPHATSAHIKVQATSGKVFTTFTSPNPPPAAEIDRGAGKVPFDALSNVAFPFRLSLKGMQGRNEYQITGDFHRVDSEAADQSDGLLIH